MKKLFFFELDLRISSSFSQVSMISLFAVLFSISFSASGRVIPITKSSYTKFIEKRPKDEIWVVMFHTDTNFQSKKLHPKFLNASVLAGGMFRFGIVDTKQQSVLTRQFMLRQQPSFIVFHQKGQSEFTGDFEPDALIDFASQYLDDKSIEIDESWSTSLPTNTKSMAILFTRKKNTPILWKGISHVFSKRKNLRIGICHNETLFHLFNVKTVPQIIFMNSTFKFTYSKKLQFAKIERTLDKFISKTLKIETEEVPDIILPSDDFPAECIGRLRICVLSTKEGPDTSFEELHRVYSTMHFKWFKGTSGIPFDFVKENEIWIYNPKVDGLIKVDNVVTMGDILEKVYESSASWTRRSELENRSVDL